MTTRWLELLGMGIPSFHLVSISLIERTKADSGPLSALTTRNRKQTRSLLPFHVVHEMQLSSSETRGVYKAQGHPGPGRPGPGVSDTLTEVKAPPGRAASPTPATAAAGPKAKLFP